MTVGMDVTRFWTQSAVLIVVGKGGVGKTTASAALARSAARNGRSVLLVELEHCGHFPQRDQPVRVIDAVVHFLEAP